MGVYSAIVDKDALVLKHQAISIQSWPDTHSITPILNKIYYIYSEQH